DHVSIGTKREANRGCRQDAQHAPHERQVVPTGSDKNDRANERWKQKGDERHLQSKHEKFTCPCPVDIIYTAYFHSSKHGPQRSTTWFFILAGNGLCSFFR